MMAIRRALILAAPVWSAGCALILGIEPTADDAPALADGGDGPQPAPDGGADGAQEAAPPDAGPFCSQGTHSFCEDFDQGALGAAWTLMRIPTEGALRLANDTYVSAPSSLYAESPAAPNDGGSNGTRSSPQLTRSMAGSFSTITIEGDVRVDEAPANTAVTAGLFGFAIVVPSGPNWHFTLHDFRSKLQLEEDHFGYPDGGFGYVYTDAPQALPVGAWTHVRIDIATTTKTHAKVVVGGVTVFDKDLAEIWGKGNAELKIGAFDMWWGVDRWRVRFDDVTLDLK